MSGPGTASGRAQVERKKKKPRRKGKTNLLREEKAGPETRPAGLVFRLHTVLFRVFTQGVDAGFSWSLASSLLTVTGLPLLVTSLSGILFLTWCSGAREGLGWGLSRDLEAHATKVGHARAVSPGMITKATKEAGRTFDAGRFAVL